MNTLNKAVESAEQQRQKVRTEWLKSVQAIADKFQVELATGQLSDVWQASEPGKEEWVLEYDADREDTPEAVRGALKALIELDEKVSEFGIGPSNMERFKPAKQLSQYDQQAESFLTRNGIKFRAVLSDSKAAPWHKAGEKSGHHYRVTLSKGKPCTPDYTGNVCSSYRLAFDFWGSIADAQAGIKTISAYDVLACISGDVNCPDTFKDYCAELGSDEDSITALQQFRRCSAFAKRLKAFFTAAELEQLAEIQ